MSEAKLGVVYLPLVQFEGSVCALTTQKMIALAQTINI